MDTLTLIKSDRFIFKHPYQINLKGEIYSPVSGRWLKTFLDKDGYVRVSLMNGESRRKSIPVHHLLMATFKPHENSIELTVNHIDGDKQNNSLENLEWMTSKENIQHALKKGLRDHRGEKNPSATIIEEQAKEIVNDLIALKLTQKEIAKKYGVSLAIVERIRGKKTWRHLTENINFPRKGLKEEEVLEIIDRLFHARYTIAELGEMYGVNKETISRIRRKESWKHLTKDIEFTKRSTTSKP